MLRTEEKFLLPLTRKNAENRMELIGGERQIDDVCDGKDQSTIQKPVSESD